MDHYLGIIMRIFPQCLGSQLVGRWSTQSVAWLLHILPCYALGNGGTGGSFSSHHPFWHLHGIDHVSHSLHWTTAHSFSRYRNLISTHAAANPQVSFVSGHKEYGQGL
jgi:hypothetical protein